MKPSAHGRGPGARWNAVTPDARALPNGDIVRIGKSEWGLPDWYGKRIRRKGAPNGRDRDDTAKEQAAEILAEAEGAAKH